MSIPEGWDEASMAGQPNVIERLGQTILDRVLSHANARMVYGDPVKEGECTVIPVARVSARFGFGGGSGRNTTEEGPSGGSGGGGGGDVKAYPVGYIEMTPHETRFQKIEDETQIALAGIRLATTAVVGVLLLTFIFVRRGRRRSKRAELAQSVAAPMAHAGRRLRKRGKQVAEEAAAVVSTAPQQLAEHLPQFDFSAVPMPTWATHSNGRRIGRKVRARVGR